MGLLVSSIFRNSSGYIPRWIDQVAGLQRILGVEVHAVVAEGDSTDDTAQTLKRALNQAPFDTTLLTVNHGGEHYGSYDIPKRWEQIALVCNAVMEKVSEGIGPDDRFIYVESDLVWTPDDLAVLYHDLDAMAAVAPLSLQGHDQDLFYDVYGYRKNGVKFTHRKPFHPELNGERYVEIDSSGSCFALRPRLARSCRFSPVDCILGIGRDVRKHGETLWLDQLVSVIHP